MAEFYDISHWEEHQHLNTGGTREKAVVENPKNSSLYYFKTSLKKIAIDYTYEFWSEIIASEIGNHLGFNVLQYDVAWNNGRIGCLSKLMIDLQHEQLFEGMKWLTDFEPGYEKDNKEAYTFQLIERMFKSKFPNEGFIEKLISTIIFDSIIGNEDRHQENWSIILRPEIITKSRVFGKNETITRIIAQYSPIYDSGSSLGRELQKDKVIRMLNCEQEFEAYINRGRSEIHWDGEKKKLRHFDLISRISNYGYREIVLKEIERVRGKNNIERISEIINNIDNCLPKELESQKIPKERKQFLIKLVNLRIEKLLALKI